MDKIPIQQQINEYCNYCERVVGMTPVTMQDKTYALADFAKYAISEGVKSLEDLTNGTINGWIYGQQERGNKGRSINGRLAQVKAMLRWQKDNGMAIAGVKMSQIVNVKEEPPRRSFFNEEQITQALACADRREWLMIKLAYDCAMRIAELRTLRLANIEGRVVRYIGKGRRARKGYMSAETRQRLDDYLLKERITDYLFPSPFNRRKPLCSGSFRAAMKQPFDDAGIAGFHPHALRHSAATNLQRRGASISEICVVLGHAHQTTTELYMHAIDDKRIEEIMENRVYCHKVEGLR